MPILPGFALVALVVVGSGDNVRQVQEKTPHPCKVNYDPSEIAAWVGEHLRDAPTGREDPRLVLLLGGSGAGKGTFIAKWQNSKGSDVSVKHPLSGFVFHGLDEYLPYIPEYQSTLADPDNVYKDAADACYGGAAIPAAKQAGIEIVNKKIDLIYEETGKSLDRIRKRVLPPFLEAGYRATIVLVYNVAEKAIERSAQRFQLTGRYAPDDYIRSTFKNNLETYEELKNIVHGGEFIYCDNTGPTIRCKADGTAEFPGLIPRDMLEDEDAEL